MSASLKTPAPAASGDLDQLAINTIRTLSMDAVQKANSGHPGTPMALAPVVHTLWQRFLRYDPKNPVWPNRDRFVLSNGHASMLLYSMLHLAGVAEFDRHDKPTGKPAVSLDDIKAFRQIDSKCPGHPEYGLTTGVETTTGPLGQGCGNSVGMAIAERWLAAQFNTAGTKLFDYNIYTLCGDGDMMEGVSGEAASVAGHLKLGNLCWIYDANTITIEGHTDLAFSEDVASRFKGYGWHVDHVKDANDAEALTKAIKGFLDKNDAPTLIIVNSLIGYGAPNKQNTAAAHGEALGPDEVKAAKRFYGWPEDAQFEVPDGIYQHFNDGVGKRGAELSAAWKKTFDAYSKDNPEQAKALSQMLQHDLPDGWDADIPTYPADAKGMATRESSGKVLNAIAAKLPWLLGGAADLAPSTKTNLTFKGAGELEAGSYGGRNMHFGIREHAMGAIVNGMVLSRLRTYGSTFLIFSDYMKPPIRLSALMEVPSLWVFTHDSIGVGEDGPTHQPIEQVLSLRAVPGLVTLRPADANEVAEAWRTAIQLSHQPAAIVVSRQPLPTFDRTVYAPASGVAKGAYILADAENGKPEVILMGTGSEVQLCVGAYEALKKEGIAARVVSMPSWELFEQQDKAYRDEVLPPGITARVSVEQASIIGWDRYVGATGARIGMHTFGSSAPLKDLLSKFGFTPQAVLAAAKDQISNAKGAAR